MTEQDVEYAINAGPNDQGHQAEAVFEHDQWWASCPRCGAQWSAVDTSNGVGLEEVAQGDQYCTR